MKKLEMKIEAVQRYLKMAEKKSFTRTLQTTVLGPPILGRSRSVKADLTRDNACNNRVISLSNGPFSRHLCG
jgi:hypothetical protein